MGVGAAGTKSPWIRLLAILLLAIFVLGIVAVTAGPAQAQAQEAEQTAKKGPSNLFVHIIESAGWFFGPLMLVVSVALVALIVLLALDLRMGGSIPPAFVDDFTDLVNKRQFKQAYDLCKDDSSYLARVTTAGLARLQYGIDDARLAAQNMVESVKASKEQLITYLATIGTLGPLLGLVGTVFGMILSFMSLSANASTPKADELAKGISHALVVTLLGIGLSVPAIFCHALFKNRLTRIAMDTSTLSDDLLTQLYHNSKKAAPAPSATPVSVPAAPPLQARAVRPVE